MLYRYLGKSGLQVSALSLGSWLTFSGQVDEIQARACIKAAYELGVNFFDSAESYGNGTAEVVIGKILKEEGWPREKLVLSTKIFFGGEGPNATGLSHKRIIEGVHGALRRLQTEYIDLVFCHRPDPHTPVEETLRAMDILIKQGKILYWGTSRWPISTIVYAHGLARQYGLTPPRMEQPPYNMFVRTIEHQGYLFLCQELGFGLTVYSPLASGILSGKYQQGIPEGSRFSLKENERLMKQAYGKDGFLSAEGIEKVNRLMAVALDVKCSVSQLALAWCLKNAQVSSVITGATSVEQVKENMEAVSVVEKLTPETMQRIEEILAA